MKRVEESGGTLSLAGESVLAEAALGRVPGLRELERAGVQTLADQQPLLVQFLAWQRLMQLRKEEQEREQEQEDVEEKPSTAQAVIMQEISRVRTTSEATRKAKQDVMLRLTVARQWAAGEAGMQDFLTAAT